VAVGAQIYTLIVRVVTSTLGVGAGTLLWLWGAQIYTLIFEQ
jgi:hypothetical protein